MLNKTKSIAICALLMCANISFSQVEAPEEPEVIGAWTLPKGFWSYPSNKLESTNWISKDKVLVPNKIKAVVGVVRETDGEIPPKEFDDKYYQIELNKKLPSGNWGVLARLPVHLFKLTDADISKSADEIVKLNGEYVEFHFEQMVIKLHFPELKQ